LAQCSQPKYESAGSIIIRIPTSDGTWMRYL